MTPFKIGNIREALKNERPYQNRLDPLETLRTLHLSHVSLSEIRRFQAPIKYRVTYYTGNPQQYWAHKDFDTLKDAVAYLNEVQPKAAEAFHNYTYGDFLDEFSPGGDSYD